MGRPMPTEQTDGTDGRTPDRYITLSARRGQRGARIVGASYILFIVFVLFFFSTVFGE